jgi:hypothetical protein
MKRLVILSAVLIGLTAAILVLLLGGSGSGSGNKEPVVEASTSGRAELAAPPLARLRALSEATRVAHGRMDGVGTTDTGSAPAPATVQAPGAVQAPATVQAPAPETSPPTVQARAPLSARERAARLSNLARSIQLTSDPGKREGLVLSYLEQASALDSHEASSDWMKRLDRLIGPRRARQ